MCCRYSINCTSVLKSVMQKMHVCHNSLLARRPRKLESCEHNANGLSHSISDTECSQSCRYRGRKAHFSPCWDWALSQLAVATIWLSTNRQLVLPVSIHVSYLNLCLGRPSSTTGESRSSLADPDLAAFLTAASSHRHSTWLSAP